MSIAMRVTKDQLDRDAARREFLLRLLGNEPPVVAESQCMVCKRHETGTVKCEAFPAGIPLGFLCGYYDHTQSFLNDKGLTFVPLASD
jgi:hypothetical protein